MADALNIEEVNKVRRGLGLPLLPVNGASSGPIFKESDDSDNSNDEPGSTLESRAAAASDNWRKLEEERKSKERRAAQKEAIRRQRDAAARFAKLEGKSLGAGDEDDLDTRAWLGQQKKRQKKIEKARKLEQELAEREAAAQAEYTEKDLAGVKVSHEVKDFGDGDEYILTLKDAAVDDDEEGDELENLDLTEKQKLSEKLKLKKKRPVYNPNDVDEQGEKSLLGQYDEVIDGKKQKRFTLDGQGSASELAKSAKAEDTAHRKGVTISLDALMQDQPASDYVEPSEVKIKKSKKKKEKSKRQKIIDDDDIFLPDSSIDNSASAVDAMAVDGDIRNANNTSAGFKRPRDAFDDDDLQSQLAQQRRAALKKRQKTNAEELARQIREERSLTPAKPESEDGSGDEPGLVIDETAAFVANLQKSEQAQDRGFRSVAAESVKQEHAESPQSDEDGDVGMSYAEAAETEESAARVKEEAVEEPEENITGFEAEGSVGGVGMSATLKLLQQRNLLKTADSGDLNAKYRDAQRFLAEKHQRETAADQRARAERERLRATGKWDRMSVREQEEWGKQKNLERAAIESRQMADVFNKSYKPNVNLNYVDDFGRHMSQKEAFKHLSHQFHGKGSGKQKTEKRLKKIEDEKKAEAMSNLDSSQSTGMNLVGGDRAKKNRQAGVRLQ